MGLRPHFLFPYTLHLLQNNHSASTVVSPTIHTFVKRHPGISYPDPDRKLHLTDMNIGFEAKRIFHNKTGLGNYSRDLVRILSHFFPDRNYYLYNPKPAKKALFIPNNINVFEKQPTGSFNRRFYNFWRQRAIIRDLKNDNIGLFHGLSGELPSGLSKNGIRSIVTIHDLIFLKFPQFYSFIDRQIHFYKFKKAAENADLVIAISEQTKLDIMEYLGIPESKIKVVYQGCQDVFKKKYPESQKEQVRKKFNLPQNFILNVGTIETRKNVLTAIKAIRDIKTSLVIIGSETAYFKEVKQYISQHKLEARVIFLKGVSSEELAILYQLADVFIYPSLYEGFGIPIIEALFSGTPVITSKGSCFPEAGGPDSIYVDPYDPEALRLELQTLLNDAVRREKIAEAGLLFAERFNDVHIADNIMRLYKQVMTE